MKNHPLLSLKIRPKNGNTFWFHLPFVQGKLILHPFSSWENTRVFSVTSMSFNIFSPLFPSTALRLSSSPIWREVKYLLVGLCHYTTGSSSCCRGFVCRTSTTYTFLTSYCCSWKSRRFAIDYEPHFARLEEAWRTVLICLELNAICE